MRGPVGATDEFVQHHVSAARQVEGGAVDEVNSDPAVGSGFDCVALANRIANFDSSRDAARTRKGA
jgi:hypothetical protein